MTSSTASPKLQGHYDIRSLNTIRSAQAVLVEDGFIHTQKGVGAFVIALPDEATSAPTLDSIMEWSAGHDTCYQRSNLTSTTWVAARHR